MALLDSEIRRLKYELGFGLVSVAGEPFVSFVSIFDQVIKPYVLAGAVTTSSTVVSISGVTTLTLANATGFSLGDTVVVDTDDNQETVTVRALSGSTITAILANTHTGTYPVTVEGGESIVRGILRQLREFAPDGGGVDGALGKAAKSAGIKKADEVEFFGGGRSGGQSRFKELTEIREYWRDELAAALGMERKHTHGGGGSMAVY